MTWISDHLSAKTQESRFYMLLVVFAVVVCTTQAQDVMHIVREYSERQAFQDEKAKDYTYDEHRTIRKLDPLGQTKSEERARRSVCRNPVNQAHTGDSK
jgi:hypothetical protein